MIRRFLPTLVALTALAFPAAAAAQDPPLPGYGEQPPTTSTVTPTTATTTPKPTPTPTPKPKPTPNVAPTNSSGANPPGTPAAAPTGTVAGASTGTTPTTLAYTGSETWLVALLGALALAGGVALMRSTRKA